MVNNKDEQLRIGVTDDWRFPYSANSSDATVSLPASGLYCTFALSLAGVSIKAERWPTASLEYVLGHSLGAIRIPQLGESLWTYISFWLCWAYSCYC